MRAARRTGDQPPQRPHRRSRRGPHARIAVEILIDTGRRPDEVQKLPWDCLETDEDGKRVLVYTDFKNNRLGCRLPSPDTTAALIREQRDRVRARLPDTGSNGASTLISHHCTAGAHRCWDPALHDICRTPIRCTERPWASTDTDQPTVTYASNPIERQSRVQVVEPQRVERARQVTDPASSSSSQGVPTRSVTAHARRDGGPTPPDR